MNQTQKAILGIAIGLLLGALVLSLKFAVSTPEAGSISNSSLVEVEESAAYD